jgi:glycosidase
MNKLNQTESSKANLLWWQQGVIYQIYPRSFMDSNGDGVGDLEGIISKLDYLEWLGVDALWLSPVYPSPMADFGYDIADYTDIDPIFGDLATFDRLVAQAHQRNLKIIIDFVPNHTSDQHAWFKESRTSRTSPKRDWYIWADAKHGENGSLPNNWLSIFGGPAWEWDSQTQQYYLHSFLKEQPDLNWRNPAVKEAMFDVLRFWLERGVDGFRIDVAHRIMKDPDLRDNPSNTELSLQLYKPFGEYDSQLHLYDAAHPDVHGIYRELRQLLDNYSTPTQPRVAIGEIHISDPHEWATYYGEQLDELHLPFNFGLLWAKWQAESVQSSVNKLETALEKGGWPNYVLGNHDEPRLLSRLGSEKAARLAMMLLLTLRGTPTLYYGDELGMSNVEIPFELVQDPFERRVPGLGLGRDGERTPMQWSATANAGFCPSAITPWLPLASNYTTVNVTFEQNEPQSFLLFTRHLLALRRQLTTLRNGNYRSIEVLGGISPNQLVFLKEGGDDNGERYLVVLNFADETQTLHLNLPNQAELLISTYYDREGWVDLKDFTLRASEGCLLRLHYPIL